MRDLLLKKPEVAIKIFPHDALKKKSKEKQIWETKDVTIQYCLWCQAGNNKDNLISLIKLC